MALNLGGESSARGASRRSRSSRPPPVERMGSRRRSPSQRANSPERYEHLPGRGERELRGQRRRDDWNHSPASYDKIRRRSRSRSRGRSRVPPTRISSPSSSRCEGRDGRMGERQGGWDFRRSTHKWNETRDRHGFARHQADIHSEASSSNRTEARARYRDKDETRPQVHRNETSVAVDKRATLSRSRKQDANIAHEGKPLSLAFGTRTNHYSCASGGEREPKPPVTTSVIGEDEKAATTSRNSDPADKEAHSNRIIRDIHGNVVSGTLYGGTVNMNYYGEPSVRSLLFDSDDCSTEEKKFLEQLNRSITADEADFGRLLAGQLKISRKADYMYDLAGEESALGRTECTHGTRTSILEAIIRWATNHLDSEAIFWLSGHGGTGKTTIAFTICHRLEALARQGGGKVALGGTFFCSRQFPETRAISAIIRTIVYQLSLKSKAFMSEISRDIITAIMPIMLKPYNWRVIIRHEI
ncbi:hypothetical protein BKA70DRAFT_1569272 [Coprinopsis sp. MPI-PUGE-AT-0042]|nr:hypothetical protein BKA70DRAFT_1569272 [Coprinopsis sp. MPI-PUGE-AT-0042]